MYAITSPVPQFFDLSGDPLDAGKIYIGTAGSNPITSPVTVYWDDAGTQPAAQPIRTVSGYPARNGKPARLYVGSDDFSITVMTRQDVLIQSELSALSIATLRGDLADAVDPAKGAGMIGFIGRTVYARLLDQVNVKDYGATGDGVTDDSADITTASNYAQSIGAVLYFPSGTYLCKAVTLHDIRVDGVIKSTASTYVDAVVLSGTIEAASRRIFEWTAANPTNLPGTTYPFVFSPTDCTFGGEVDVKWFGATADHDTDDTPFLNACTTAMSFVQPGATPYAPKTGPVVMKFPKGNYRIEGTICLTGGVIMRGEASGSNPLSTLIRNEADIGSASAADMIWVVKDNVTYTQNPTQSFFEKLSFVWRPTSDFGSSTLQIYTSFIKFKASSISVKVNDCWFLGSPQKGSIFGWGNDFAEDGSGVGIAKVDTGADADGIYVDINVNDGTVIDVIYGTICTVTDKGYGAIQIWNPYIYQLWMGLCLNTSTHSTRDVEVSLYGGFIDGMCVQLAPLYPVASTGINSNTVWREQNKLDIGIYGTKIKNAYMSSQSFCFTNCPVNSSITMLGCEIDSTDPDAQYSTQMFKLDWRANSLTLIGNEFHGSMTPNPATITAPWPKAMISKLTGAIGADGVTSNLCIMGNRIEIGTMDYFIKKETAYSQITRFICTGNDINITSAKFAFDTTGVPKYVMANNTFANTTNSLQTIP